MAVCVDHEVYKRESRVQNFFNQADDNGSTVWPAAFSNPCLSRNRRFEREALASSATLVDLEYRNRLSYDR